MNSTINISVPTGLMNLAKDQVKKGYYSSMSEVIREALRNHFMADNVPTFPMSAKAKKVLHQARKEQKEGKTIKIQSFDEITP